MPHAGGSEALVLGVVLVAGQPHARGSDATFPPHCGALVKKKGRGKMKTTFFFHCGTLVKRIGGTTFSPSVM